jgi:hypothetical protein
VKFGICALVNPVLLKAPVEAVLSYTTCARTDAAPQRASERRNARETVSLKPRREAP